MIRLIPSANINVSHTSHILPELFLTGKDNKYATGNTNTICRNTDTINDSIPPSSA